MTKRILRSIFLTGGLLALVMGGSLAAQDAANQTKEESFAQKLWTYLEKAEYETKYKPWPGAENEFFPGKSPHGAHLKVYVNEKLTENPDDPPHQAIIVKNNYTPEKELDAITVMYRVDGYDPENKNWYWVKYLPDGKVAEMNGMKLSGKVEGCINCHSSAEGGDYIFMNDK